jgi:hypothetical protein
MVMGKPILSFFFFLFLSCGFAQVNTGGISSFAQTDFAFEVKTIDEFIERFNNDKYTLIRQYMEQKFPGKELSRLDMIRTLFNYDEPLWQPDDALAFSGEILKENEAQLLDFYSEKWYAEAECLVKYKGIPKRVRITLQVLVSDRTGAAKWVICGARAPFLDLSNRVDPKKFLNPISHATDFIGLKNAMDDKAFVRNFLSDEFHESHLNKYLGAVATGDIVFDQVSSISYHFLSVPGWLFTVKEYRRPGKNSGWLIQSLSRKTDAEKKEYLKNNLNCDF